MLTFIDELPVSISGGTMDEEEYAKSEEFKEITGALKTLAKHCPTFVLSAYTKEDHAAIVYNHAMGNEMAMGRSYELTKREKGERAAREALRGTELATHITNLLVEGAKDYHISASGVIGTVKKGIQVMAQLNDLSDDDKKELLDAMKNSNSLDETLEKIYEKFDIDEDDEPHFSDSKRFEGLREAFGDTFAATDSKTDANIQRIKKVLEKETGSEIHAVKMSDPAVIEPLAKSLSDNLESTVVVGFLKVDEKGGVATDSSVVTHWQKNIKEIARKNNLSEKEVRIASAASMAMSILNTIKDKYNLPDGLFADYMRREGL